MLRVIGARRRGRAPGHSEAVELETPDNVVDIVDAHDRLRAALAAAGAENERAALGRVMRGEPIARREGAQVALSRLRRKVAALSLLAEGSY